MIQVQNEVRKANFQVDMVNILLGTQRQFNAIIFTHGLKAKGHVLNTAVIQVSISRLYLLTAHTHCLKLFNSLLLLFE